jgi:hypothetical protein
MHQLPAFANMTMSVRRELCSVMVFEVVEQAGAVILEDGQEVGQQIIKLISLSLYKFKLFGLNYFA